MTFSMQKKYSIQIQRIQKIFKQDGKNISEWMKQRKGRQAWEGGA